jgi:hypothetical protein
MTLRFAFVRRLLLSGVTLLLAACGGSSVEKLPAKPLYAGGPWAVVVQDGRATAYHQVGKDWRADTTGKVKIDVLGPRPGSSNSPRPQLAAQISGNAPLVESGMWVDGRELTVKGGGVKPTVGTIYGAPDTALAKGSHTAVAFGRTDAHATAVAWTFRVV